MTLLESGEMYLESIYLLLQRSNRVRAVDVAAHMNFSKPSVSRGLGLLRQGGYLLTDADGYLSLTEAGKAQAERIYNRHVVIRDMLMRIGVDEETATQDACRIEHIISDATFEAICRHTQHPPKG